MISDYYREFGIKGRLKQRSGDDACTINPLESVGGPCRAAGENAVRTPDAKGKAIVHLTLLTRMCYMDRQQYFKRGRGLNLEQTSAY